MKNLTELTENDAGFVEVLTADNTGTVFGYRLRGASAGPQVVVAGVHDTCDRVFDRILSIPTLPWMRGNLVLIRLEALENLPGHVSALGPLGPLDRTIMLPWGDAGALTDLEVRNNYHLVLRTCANLGMISGRGVARTPLPLHASAC